MMKKSLLILTYIVLTACQATNTTDVNKESINPSIVGIVKKQGKPAPSVQIVLSSAICSNSTAITNSQGEFRVQQFCNVTNTGPGSILGVPTYLFNVQVTDGQQSYLWSVMNPFDLTVDFDLTEQLVCVTNDQQNRCSNLVAIDTPQ